MTGLDAIQKILDTVNELKNIVNEIKDSVSSIEANIKVLNNRAAGLLLASNENINNKNSVINPSQSSLQESNSIIKQLTAAAPEAQSGLDSSQIVNDGRGALTYKKVFGKLINNTNEPIETALIKIYDKNNEVCATAETDAIGYFETMLKPGRYVAEYLKSGFKTTNKTFEVNKNTKETEIR